jgi:hypothetical protein
VAEDGGLKFDCSQFDDQYFDHVLTVLDEADARGIVLGIILWDEIPLESEDRARWEHNPFCPGNSVNDYGLPSCSGNAVPEFYDINGNYGDLRDHQDAIVRKFVDTLKDEPNVFFFISNEYTGPESWRTRQINTLNDRCNAVGCDLLHVSMNYSGSYSDVSDGVSCDISQFCQDNWAWRPDNRPSITERDCNSCGPYRPVMWERFFEGVASAGTRDDYSGDTPPGSTFSAAADEDQQLRRFVNSINSALDRLVPDNGPFGSNWKGRVSPGQEYVAYSDGSSGSITVDLGGESGSWELFDWDPSGTSSPVGRGVRNGGASATWSVRGGECAVRIAKVGSADTTPPTQPQNLSGTPAGEHQIDLTWSAASDAESGIAYYRVYRNGNPVAESTGLSYQDTGLSESTSYDYAVSAVNGAALESQLSATIQATTMADTTPPSIVSVAASGDPAQLVVVFSEPVEQSSSTSAGNYAIDNGVTVSSATLSTDLVTVTLGTSPHSEGVLYTLTVNNVRDRAAQPNSIAANSSVTYNFVAQLVISNLVVGSGRSYEVGDDLDNGSVGFIDRGFVYQQLPSTLIGSKYIRTANDDKTSQGDSFLSFDVNQSVTVYVAHDDRYSLKPTWLQAFVDTGDDTSLDSMPFSLFKKDFGPGTVTLGGNVNPAEAEDNTMYTVIVTPGGTAPVEPPSAPQGLVAH